MKGIFSLLMICTMSLTVCTSTLTACAVSGGSENKNISSNSQSSIGIESNADNNEESAADVNDNADNSGQSIRKEEADMKINIVIGNETFTGTLEDNDTARKFAGMLPLTLDMSELNGNEKYNVLSENIKKDDSSNPGTINAGDIMCYSNNYIVLFYKTFKTSYSYVPVGHVDDVERYVKALGKGDLKVTLKPAEK